MMSYLDPIVRADIRKEVPWPHMTSVVMAYGLYLRYLPLAPFLGGFLIGVICPNRMRLFVVFMVLMIVCLAICSIYFVQGYSITFLRRR